MVKYMYKRIKDEDGWLSEAPFSSAVGTVVIVPENGRWRVERLGGMQFDDADLLGSSLHVLNSEHDVSARTLLQMERPGTRKHPYSRLRRRCGRWG